MINCLPLPTTRVLLPRHHELKGGNLRGVLQLSLISGGGAGQPLVPGLAALPGRLPGAEGGEKLDNTRDGIGSIGTNIGANGSDITNLTNFRSLAAFIISEYFQFFYPLVTS